MVSPCVGPWWPLPSRRRGVSAPLTRRRSSWEDASVFDGQKPPSSTSQPQYMLATMVSCMWSFCTRTGPPMGTMHYLYEGDQSLPDPHKPRPHRGVDLTFVGCCLFCQDPDVLVDNTVLENWDGNWNGFRSPRSGMSFSAYRHCEPTMVYCYHQGRGPICRRKGTSAIRRSLAKGLDIG